MSNEPCLVVPLDLITLLLECKVCWGAAMLPLGSIIRVQGTRSRSILHTLEIPGTGRDVGPSTNLFSDHIQPTFPVDFNCTFASLKPYLTRNL